MILMNMILVQIGNGSLFFDNLGNLYALDQNEKDDTNSAGIEGFIPGEEK